MSVSIWRDASRGLTLFGIPCLAYLPLFGWLFHMRWWTLYTAVAVIVVFAILAKFGLTLRVLWGKFLHLLRGSKIYSRGWWYRNRFNFYD
ncbi:IcmT/TraK family protein [Pseudomonas sp. NPDC077405]|uniref:IcmT/TraK family protein n=1 Tax=Stutzerimonas nitrititolerans TaxID=2482751 RepID=UPI0028AA6C99|nr:IcmT/TraK family protein [Stutzerimonas nitrititolerans]